MQNKELTIWRIPPIEILRIQHKSYDISCGWISCNRLTGDISPMNIRMEFISIRKFNIKSIVRTTCKIASA